MAPQGPMARLSTRSVGGADQESRRQSAAAAAMASSSSKEHGVARRATVTELARVVARATTRRGRQNILGGFARVLERVIWEDVGRGRRQACQKRTPW